MVRTFGYAAAKIWNENNKLEWLWFKFFIPNFL